MNRYEDVAGKADQYGLSITALLQLACVNADEVLYRYRDTPAESWAAVLDTCTWIEKVQNWVKDEDRVKGQSFHAWYTQEIGPGVRAGAVLAYRKDLLEQVLAGQLSLEAAGKAGWPEQYTRPRGKKPSTNTRKNTRKATSAEVEQPKELPRGKRPPKGSSGQ